MARIAGVREPLVNPLFVKSRTHINQLVQAGERAVTRKRKYVGVVTVPQMPAACQWWVKVVLVAPKVE